MNLASEFARNAKQHGPAIALFWGDLEGSYQDLLDQSCRLARFLAQECNLTKGDRIGLWLKNRPEFIPALFATWIAQGVVVPINNFLRPREVAYILADAGINTLITETALAEGFNELRASQHNLSILQIEDLAQLPSPHPSP